MEIPHTKGLIAAPCTPFTKDGGINLIVIKDYIQFLMKNGVVGAFVNGTTGEGLSLSVEERKKIAEEWVKYAPEGFKIIIHIGHNSIKDSQEFGKHAQTINSDAIAGLGPTFLRPDNVEDLVDWSAEQAASAPDLPFYYYHLPALTFLNFSMPEFIKLAEKKIPNFVGVKYSQQNILDYAKCVQYSEGKYDIMFGKDEFLITGLQMGGKAAVGSTYNFAAPLYNNLIDAFNNKKMEKARELQLTSMDMVKTLFETGKFLATVKFLVSKAGIDVGPVRTPLKNLTISEKDNLLKKLNTLGYSTFKNK